MKHLSYILLLIFFLSCGKKSPAPSPVPPPPSNFNLKNWSVDGMQGSVNYIGVNVNADIRLIFGAAINKATVAAGIQFKNASGGDISFTTSFENGDSTIRIQPSAVLSYLSRYEITISNALKSAAGGAYSGSDKISIYTKLDESPKFATISDNALLDLVQKTTFKYFWDFAHPISGLARERNTSGETVTSGGSGFGIMTIPVAVERAFITRAEAVARMQKIVAFLKNTAETFHGAYPHWLNGTTGKVVPFSAKDNGADLVETSYLAAGLMTARQYFSLNNTDETSLRSDINAILDKIEWNWFRKANENVLYWHWSPNYGWDMNMQIRGWNEALITYIMAAASTTYTIDKPVYDNGWAQNGNMKNNNSYFNYTLPLGPAMGGPLFFAHYSFLGVYPNGLKDAYADYQTQVVNHTKINYEYVKSNPKGYYGYSANNWGLTASDIQNGYTASSPTNDVGVIAPTAALSSFPYSPTESMNALKFFYYTIGDKIWKTYGFTDAFSLHTPWFADSFLAIDQGPIIIMIENYRTGLIWNLLTGSPEIKAGMKKLGFTAPYL